MRTSDRLVGLLQTQQFSCQIGANRKLQVIANYRTGFAEVGRQCLNVIQTRRREFCHSVRRDILRLCFVVRSVGEDEPDTLGGIGFVVGKSMHTHDLALVVCGDFGAIPIGTHPEIRVKAAKRLVVADLIVRDLAAHGYFPADPLHETTPHRVPPSRSAGDSVAAQASTSASSTESPAPKRAIRYAVC